MISVSAAMSPKFGHWLKGVIIVGVVFFITIFFFTPSTLDLRSSLHNAGQELRTAGGRIVQTGSGYLSGHSSKPAEGRAYATFLATRGNDTTKPDTYFTAVRVLNYQLQYAPETRTNRSIPFVVLVAPWVTEEKRKTLRGEGATVVEVAILEPEDKSWLKPGEVRFADQFTKLRLFELTQYSQILYLDADMLLQRSLDEIWDEPVAREVMPTLESSSRDEHKELDALLPSNYSLVGVSDTGGANHDFPPSTGNMLNGGFFILRPSKELFNYYVSCLNTPNLFDTGLMEQSLLNYAHSADSRMPWQSFPPGKWNVNWPRLKDVEGGAATLHDKFWESGNKDWIERELVEKWWRVQGQMEGYWQKHEENRKYWQRSQLDDGR